MSLNFLSLPPELRNQIYKLVLLHQEPITTPRFEYNIYREQKLTPGLLCANKTIHREASWLFYAQNRFDLTRVTPDDVALFLETIGRNNADYIRHIYADFPKFLCSNVGQVTLEDDSVSILANFQSGCANLSTLTVSVDSTSDMEDRFAALDDFTALDHPKVVTEALRLINTHFRAIPSLQKVIVEVCEDGPSDLLRKEMESHGWTISTAKNVEEDDFDDSLSDFDFDDYGHDSGDDDDDYDDYDIASDSDLWRRA